MYFALQEIASMDKDDEGRKRKKDVIQIAPLIWGKGLVICNF